MKMLTDQHSTYCSDSNEWVPVGGFMAEFVFRIEIRAQVHNVINYETVILRELFPKKLIFRSCRLECRIDSCCPDRTEDEREEQPDSGAPGMESWEKPASADNKISVDKVDGKDGHWSAEEVTVEHWNEGTVSSCSDLNWPSDK